MCKKDCCFCKTEQSTIKKTSRLYSYGIDNLHVPSQQLFRILHCVKKWSGLRGWLLSYSSVGGVTYIVVANLKVLEFI